MYFEKILILFLAVLGPALADQNAGHRILRSTDKHMSPLRHDLLQTRGYDRKSRPVIEPSTQINVSVKLTVENIARLDSKNRILNTQIWMEMVIIYMI